MNIEEGDIFELSINPNSKNYGQIVKIPNQSSIAVVIFKESFRNTPPIDKLVTGEILFFGLTFDAKFYTNEWKIIGNITSNSREILLPNYKVGIDPVYLEDFAQNTIRKLNESELEFVSYRKYVAPVRFELALKAYHLVGEWKPSYDSLLYTRVIKSRELSGIEL